jgi:hypothetical protein
MTSSEYTVFHNYKTGQPCPAAKKRWRYLPDGHIEVEGEGVLTKPWPAGVNQWREEIEAAAADNGVPAAYIAAIMAHETGGKNVCLSAAALPAMKVCGPPCKCVQNEGAGVMAMIPSTATGLAKRKVTSQELLDNTPLAIDLGAKYLKRNLDRHKSDDFMYGAVAHNADTVRCGRGGTFIPSGTGWPKAPCPHTGWGVVFGCTYQPKNWSHVTCVPSPAGSPKPYVCSTNYADTWKLLNAAIDQGYSSGKTGPKPPIDKKDDEVAAASIGARHLGAAALGALVGYALVSALSKKL